MVLWGQVPSTFLWILLRVKEARALQNQASVSLASLSVFPLFQGLTVQCKSCGTTRKALMGKGDCRMAWKLSPLWCCLETWLQGGITAGTGCGSVFRNRKDGRWLWGESLCMHTLLISNPFAPWNTAFEWRVPYACTSCCSLQVVFKKGITCSGNHPF